jgi:hypothetical protein
VHDRRPNTVEPLTDEQRVFVECVEDILATTPGLQYGLLLDGDLIARRDSTVYAVFLLRADPGCNLSLAIELSDQAFVVRVNRQAFRRVRGKGTRFECWVERRCRDLERMINGDIRLVHKTLMNMPTTSTLEVGNESRWHKFGTTENGWLAILAYLTPYGFLMGGERKRVYKLWSNPGNVGPDN